MNLQNQINIWQTLPRPFYVLAPMEDVTCTVFRRLIASCGRPDLFFTEFTSTDGMVSELGNPKVSHRLVFEAEEKPLIAQIWGNNPEHYLKSSKMISEMGFDGIDINMGCPVEKIIKGGSCAALIDNPELAKELYLAAKEGAQGLPVSIKTRIGFKKRAIETWGSTILSLKPAALTVHGRTAKQLSTGNADWSAIKEFVTMRNSLSSETVMIGNGDVMSLQEADNKIAESGVDGVMIGRGIFHNPYLFDRNATSLIERTVSEKLGLLLKHLDLFEADWGAKKPFRILKKYFKIYATGFEGAAALRLSLVEAESFIEVRDIVNTFLQQSTLCSSVIPNM